MSKSGRTVAFLSAAVVVVAALSFCFRSEPNSTASLSAVGSRGSETSPDAAVSSLPLATAREKLAVVADSAAASRALKMGDGLQTPKSPEQLAWLIRNGFPSEQQREYANSVRASLSQLDPNVPATAEKIIQAENLALTSPGEREAALAYLRDAAADGSIYALQSLGATSSIGPEANRTLAQAYYNAAQARGEWNEALRGGGGLSAEQQVVAAFMGQQILANLNRIRAQRNLPPLGFDIRPGLDEALHQMQDAQEHP